MRGDRGCWHGKAARRPPAPLGRTSSSRARRLVDRLREQPRHPHGRGVPTARGRDRGRGPDGERANGRRGGRGTGERGHHPGAIRPARRRSSGGAEHTVVWGESLWSVATANGISVEALAAANGLAANAYLIEGQTITVPAATPAPRLGSRRSPALGDLYLTTEAAGQWNAMRDDSITNYGVDLYPGGPASAYRTTEQQEELHDLYLRAKAAGEPAGHEHPRGGHRRRRRRSGDARRRRPDRRRLCAGAARSKKKKKKKKKKKNPKKDRRKKKKKKNEKKRGKKGD